MYNLKYMAAEEAGAEGGAPEAPKRKLDKQTMLVLVNTLLVLAALGTLAYTKLLYKKPAITEHVELEKKQEEIKAAPEPSERPLVKFDQMTINIAMTSGKAHYATVAFAIECRDEPACAAATEKKAILTDKLIAALGRRQITELNTIQGKLLLKSELVRRFNEALSPGAVTDLYFSSFILQ